MASFPTLLTVWRPSYTSKIKNVRRVRDDIQKRLYELAEAAVEMKLLYGSIELTGFALDETVDIEAVPALRSEVRRQLTASPPVVVALFLCPRSEAERYRDGAEAFIDRVFFQEEVDECLDFLRSTIERLDAQE